MQASSRSKLKRISDRLKGAIIDILNMSKTQQPTIDYASLVSLSNSSRVDAIKTMDELSHRLHKPSSGSLARKRKSSSSSSSSSPSSNSKNAPRHKSADTTANKPNKGGKPPDFNQRKTRKAGQIAQIPGSSLSQYSSTEHMHPKKVSKPVEDDYVGALRNSSASPRLRTSGGPGAQNRISYLSMSSDSTKLGEIPFRRSRLVRNADNDEFEYSYRAIYPLNGHRPITEEKSGGFFKRLFGTREKD